MDVVRFSFIFCLILLSGCASVNKDYESVDKSAAAEITIVGPINKRINISASVCQPERKGSFRERTSSVYVNQY